MNTPTPPPADPASPPAARPGERKKVVYVEDNLLNAMLMREMLASEPVELVVVGSGKAALELLERETPDLVLLDMQLPDMNGLEIFQKLKAAGHVPQAGCVILSADATTERIQAAMEIGIKDYWTKPFNLMQVLAKLRGLLALPD